MNSKKYLISLGNFEYLIKKRFEIIALFRKKFGKVNFRFRVKVKDFHFKF